jgi:class 3 adenylate cyclase/pimeloyl-ACP methyl ester carboxylesterase
LVSLAEIPVIGGRLLTAEPVERPGQGMERPKTQYAKSGDLHIAYQTFGQGPPDIVFVAPYITHVEAQWEVPQFARFLEGLSRIGRLVLFDAAGSGMSDPAPGLKRTLDSWTNDVQAVMDAVGVARAAILCFDSAGAKAVLFAATYPERVSSLILVNTSAKVFRANDYPEGVPAEGRLSFVDWYLPQWGTGTLLRFYSKSTKFSEDDIQRHGRLERHVASPGAAREHLNLVLDMDVREALPLIQAPTLVVHRRDNRSFPVAQGRYLAAHIPNAKYVELPGDAHAIWWGDVKAMLDEISEFLTGVRQVPVTNRTLATILFTDIVGSTEQAAKLGDRQWRELLDRHDEILEEAVGRFQGRLVKKTGDGGLATFQGPTRAIEAARAIRDGTRALGLEVRVGVHTGECELRGEDVGGIAVHIASRIAALASGGELLVSRTVKDLVVGSGIAFEDRGMHTLKGVPDQWHLYIVTQ